MGIKISSKVIHISPPTASDDLLFSVLWVLDQYFFFFVVIIMLRMLSNKLLGRESLVERFK